MFSRRRNKPSQVGRPAYCPEHERTEDESRLRCAPDRRRLQDQESIPRAMYDGSCVEYSAPAVLVLGEYSVMSQLLWFGEVDDVIGARSCALPGELARMAPPTLVGRCRLT